MKIEQLTPKMITLLGRCVLSFEMKVPEALQFVYREFSDPFYMKLHNVSQKTLESSIWNMIVLVTGDDKELTQQYYDDMMKAVKEIK